ncbi:hypothetical protein SLS58_010614 [Diplodia intermedia]|uniref:histidine kinase n=1 Tax=Diplodia intermedia TaxID=856260 RepID=A0ABR3T4Z7_9PEZI
MNCSDATTHSYRKYTLTSLLARFYQAAINALELRLVEDAPGCTVPPVGFVPRPCKDTALTAFAQLGALRLNANRGLISLLDGKYQYILAEATRTLSLLPTVEPDPNDNLWLGSVIISRSKGVCEHVLSLGDVIQGPISIESDIPAVVIKDLAKDPRFVDRSYVLDDPKVRFYAGVPLRSPWGKIIGAFCVFGHEPRDGLTQEQLIALQGIATTVMAYLETSKAKEGHRRYEQMLHGLTSFVTGDTSMQSLDGSQRAPFGRPPPVQQHSSSSVNAGSSSEDLGRPMAVVRNTPPPMIQSSKGKKRPRVLSTSTFTARKRSTTSLQETMLPSGSKNMFSRAASIMRESIDLCGCVIFDASVATYGAAIDSPYPERSAESQLDSSPKTSPAASNNDHGSHGLSPNEEYFRIGTQTSSSDGDGLSDKKMCEILGVSLKESTGMPINDPEAFCPDLAEKDLKKLLKKFPSGHIFNVSSAGEISSSQSSDSPPEMAPKSKAADCTDPKARVSRRVLGGKENRLLQKLLEVAPRARSIAILPLWDYQRNRWFAGCLCWTTEPSRLLYPDVDLIYLQAFGNSIMMELSRLDAITSDRAKTTFVASISHELRCPLHGILGGVQFLQDTPLDTYQAGMLDSVAMCGKTLLDTIDHVLDFAKINTFTRQPLKDSSSRRQEPIDLTVRKGSQSLSEPANLFANIDLAMLTEEVIEAVFVGHSHLGASIRLEKMEDQAKTVSNICREHIRVTTGNLKRESDKAVRLVLDIPHRRDWSVTTQPGAWRRVVMNLVGNALKYTKSGYIRVSMRTRQAELGPRQESNSIDVTLVVSDSGKGMSSEYLRSGVWRPFSQEDSFSPGTGLGLSIVRQIVQGLKGTIDLKSEVQVGTEVRVNLSLPLAESPRETDDDDRYLLLAASKMRNRAVCILETASLGDLDHSVPTVRKGRRELAVALSKTLKGWFGANAVVSNLFTALSTDVIICLEPQLDLLTTLKGMKSPENKPLVIFIVLHAAEATALRSDPRVLSSRLTVDIITQPIIDPDTIPRTLVEKYPADTSVQEPPTTTHLRILLVDDNRINLSLLTAFMRRYNFDYQEAMNGLQAVETYKRDGGHFDYVLMDLTMPVMDGMAATREIRRHEQREGLRPTIVIALTGLASAAARVDALNSGINFFLTKPVKFQALHQMLKGVAAGAGAAGMTSSPPLSPQQQQSYH